MIRRRLALGGLATSLFQEAYGRLPVPPGGGLSFRIIRKDSTIGQHTISFQQAGSALIVSVSVDIVVGFGPIAFFRYKHRATVHWQGDQVISIDAKTNDDGGPEYMAARRDEAELVVEGSKAPRYSAPSRSLPGTHWNRAMLDAPFINTEDGRLMSPTVTLVGIEKVPVTGGAVKAQHYTMRGDVNLDTFYDLTPSWVGLRFTARDGSNIRYLRA